MEKIRVLVNGAEGRMGQEVVKSVTAAADLELVDQTDLGDDLIARINASQAQAVVDFTPAAAAFENTRKILEAGVHPDGLQRDIREESWHFIHGREHDCQCVCA